MLFKAAGRSSPPFPAFAKSGIPYVATNNVAIARLAAKHLLERALPHFGYYGLRSSPVAVWSDARAAAFSRSISAAGQQAAVLMPLHDSTRWQVEERFRRLVGRSIRDDILEVRLAEARRLVTTTDLPLKTIAPRAGFRSIAYMTTVFRRHFGTTPAAFRAAARGGP